MSLDTKYRPHVFDDVVGQQGTIEILRKIICGGTGFQQSYIFAGPHGTGKTTLGRILARSILCEAPNKDGNFCGDCISCRAFDLNAHECFIEIDAATNSGKADMKEIVERLEYSTFSGRRRLYLFDESHQLSKDALDAILKPMEDQLSGSEERKLVCIFCTTEPEKMRRTILSRCAPVFQVRKPPVEDISKRLAYICEQEQIEFEVEALSLIAEISEAHIRDCLKAVEGIALLGAVTREHVVSYLHLDANSEFVKVLLNMGIDLKMVMQTITELVEISPPSILYEKLAETALLAYRLSLGIKSFPSYWSEEDLGKVASLHGNFLVQVANHLSDRPRRATKSMLDCDLAFLHHARNGGMKSISSTVSVVTPQVSAQIDSSPETPISFAELMQSGGEPSPEMITKSDPVGNVSEDGAVFMPNIAKASKLRDNVEEKSETGTTAYFFQIMGVRLRELEEEKM